MKPSGLRWPIDWDAKPVNPTSAQCPCGKAVDASEDFMVCAAEWVALGTSVIIRWTTSSGGRSNGLRYRQLKSPSVSYSKTENVPVAPHGYATNHGISDDIEFPGPHIYTLNTDEIQVSAVVVVAVFSSTSYYEQVWRVVRRWKSGSRTGEWSGSEQRARRWHATRWQDSSSRSPSNRRRLTSTTPTATSSSLRSRIKLASRDVTMCAIAVAAAAAEPRSSPLC